MIRGIVQQRTVRRGEVVAGQLQSALTSRVVIEQAKGVLAERLQISPDDAFGVLRAAARSRNRLLSQLALDVASGSADAAALLRQAPGQRGEPRSARSLSPSDAGPHRPRPTPA